MCLQCDASCVLDEIDSMEVTESRDCTHLTKDCSVVVVPLIPDIVRRKTVKVLSVGDCIFAAKDSSSFELICVNRNTEAAEASLPISVYSSVNNGVITDVRCEDFRKRKCDFGSDTEDEDEVIEDVVKSLLDEIASEPARIQSIDFASPGIKEVQLIKDFCRENGYESRDYRDLESLFTFRTLPIFEVRRVIKSSSKRCKVQKKMNSVHSGVNSVAVSTCSSLDESGLEKIENLRIRKILEDFGRLSRGQEKVQAAKQRKNRTYSNSSNKNSSFNKPLNLCKKDHREMEKPIKISKSVQSDISISGSILRTLLHNQENLENDNQDGGKEGAEKTRENAEESNQKKTSKKSTAQQTDEDAQSETNHHNNNKSDKWLNDPTAILKKIQKLKKDILYLDLLAEEKEKERIAILCFKNYKESILKKIFANEMSDTRSRVIDAARSSAIPKLIHPPSGSNSALEHPPLNSVLFPSSNSVLQTQDSSCSTLQDNPQVLNQTNENFVRLANCMKCDFMKSNYLNPNYRSLWYCHPLFQTHSCIRRDKECRGLAVDSSTN